jgi:hypothetical protein
MAAKVASGDGRSGLSRRWSSVDRGLNGGHLFGDSWSCGLRTVLLEEEGGARAMRQPVVWGKQRQFLVSVGGSGGRGEQWGEQGQGGSGRRRKGEALWSGTPLIAARGGGRGRWKRWAERRPKRWRNHGWTRQQPRSVRGQHGGAIVRTVWLTSGAHAVSYFPELSKAAQTWKFKMDAVPYSTNCQFFHVARFTHYEQFSQLCRHLILNRIRVKNPRTD